MIKVKSLDKQEKSLLENNDVVNRSLKVEKVDVTRYGSDFTNQIKAFIKSEIFKVDEFYEKIYVLRTSTVTFMATGFFLHEGGGYASFIVHSYDSGLLYHIGTNNGTNFIKQL